MLPCSTHLAQQDAHLKYRLRTLFVIIQKGLQHTWYINTVRSSLCWSPPADWLLLLTLRSKILMTCCYVLQSMCYHIVVLNSHLNWMALVVQEKVKLQHIAHYSLCSKMFSINLLRAMHIPVHSSMDFSHNWKVRLTIVRHITHMKSTNICHCWEKDIFLHEGNLKRPCLSLNN